MYRMERALSINYTGMVILTMSAFLFSDKISHAQSFQIQPTFGITARSTVMNFFNFKSIEQDPLISYNYEKNLQGLGYNVGVQLNTASLGMEYWPSFRYDYTHHYYDPKDNKLINIINGDSIFTNDSPLEIKEFIVDHNFNFYFTKKIKYGFGLSIVNTGKGFYYKFPGNIQMYKNLEFKTYNVFVIIPVKMFELELKALYIPKDMPDNPNDKYIMYSLRAFYKFDFLNKKK